MDLTLYLPVLVAIGVAVWAAVAYGGAKPGDRTNRQSDRTPDE